LAHLEQRGILHRDLKPENLLVDMTNQTIRVSDFGLARCAASVSDRVDPDDFDNSDGTLPYMAPEILLNIDKHTFASDMWAVGIIFGELMAGRTFIKGGSRSGVIKSIAEHIGPPSKDYMKTLEEKFLPSCIMVESAIEHLADDAGTEAHLKEIFRDSTSDDIDLLKKIMTMDPVVRLSAADALKHPCLKGIADADGASSRILSQSYERISLPLDDVDEERISVKDINLTLETHLKQTYSSGGCRCIIL